jgi:hypothetical protein
MKTRKFLIIPIIAAGVCFIPALALSNTYADRPAENRSESEIRIYTPLTPTEAGFEEESVYPSSVYSTLLKSFAPVTPSEAEFTDDNDLNTVFSPVTPREAEFDENV